MNQSNKRKDPEGWGNLRFKNKEITTIDKVVDRSSKYTSASHFARVAVENLLAKEKRV